MSLFLIVFFLLYGSLNFYAFFKAKAAFTFGVQTGFLIGFFMFLMIMAPLIVRLSEKAGFEFFARLMSYTGYTWMGVLFLFVSVSLLVDLYRLILLVSGLIMGKDFSALTVSNRYAFFIPLAVSIVIAIYGYFEARNIRTETVIIETKKIPKEIGSLKIVQISDIHLGLIVREERLKSILKKVVIGKPDMLVSTGDLVDGQIDNLYGLAKLLYEINPRYGKFAITGNHEYYAGIKESVHFMEDAGFRVLRGERLTVADIIDIVGVDDPAGRYYNSYKDIPERQLLSEHHSDRFTLFLKHRPVIDKSTIGLFDLQLSGHVHKGQIFPFSIITGLYYATQAGIAKLSNNTFLYVSRGAGTWGPPIRFLSPPEVTLIDLVHKD
jgi:predicted MPP superfamily phosphohydrolase